MNYRLAIIEDDNLLRENYTDVFGRQGYRVDAYANRMQAQEVFQSKLPDLAIIDIGLGDEVDGGFALCQWLRAKSRTLPIIFLSARDDDIDIVSGLRMGADDYLTKDVSLPHLVARVAALFRRIEALASDEDSSTTTISEGLLYMDVQRLTCRWNEVVVELTLTEFWMIYALVKRVGHVKNREQLMQEAQMVVDESTITSHIKRIRRKFQVLDQKFDCIETVYGMGYRWNSHQ
ncbi:MAG: proteobacterial dedicated sortase system response regulator [Gammaproteobacteria bacterium]|jgi:two-component system OmpR family response regulator|nr:proteobacterial dedicated sortase system response regulator [Gammaproteobacteria bacterium]MBT3867194.1 proteobacterial dedicated sortase system response regulator [Gammaproteobacteria bacterium]MBT4379733.1 proteobacterial dedicated sortase system response regulator [Gammaproteobacteria bacterium]MBT4618659.1 proteobacterial dedicated sortase system response regulator [Gammaproteobacteria bacterium]MBT5198749.1 proteobacterial dedicated sortase system response regulator [Gammaproteobacteria